MMVAVIRRTIAGIHLDSLASNAIDDSNTHRVALLTYILDPTMSNAKSSLFLGLDLSTQQFKAIIITESMSVVHESAVNFAKDLPQYGTVNGVFVGPGPGEVTSPVAMWVHALDILMERLQASGVEISRVAAISGACQVCSNGCEFR